MARRRRLEATVADGAILHPELVDELAIIVTPLAFADDYLGAVFSGALRAPERTPETAYQVVHFQLVADGVHHCDREVIDLFSLGGRGVLRDTGHAVEHAIALADVAERSRLAAALVAAHASVTAGADPAQVVARLRLHLGHKEAA